MRVKTYADSVLVQDVSYVYDFNNNLIGRSITTEAGTTVTRFVNDGGNMALAFDGSGNLQDRYLDAGAVDHILADEKVTDVEDAGETLWPLPDNQGTIRDVIFADGSLDDHFAYDAFGVRTGGGETEDFLFGYTGVYTDPATGLQYHNDPSTGIPGRWYNPALQRWISADPTDLAAGPNPLEYANNSPTNGIDRSGLHVAASSLSNEEGDYLELLDAEYRYGDGDEYDNAVTELGANFGVENEQDLNDLLDETLLGSEPTGGTSSGPEARPPAASQMGDPVAAPTDDDDEAAFRADQREFDDNPETMAWDAAHRDSDGAERASGSPETHAGGKSEFDIIAEARADAFRRIGLLQDARSEYCHSFDSRGAASDIRFVIGGYSIVASLPFMLATDGAGAAEFMAADTGGSFGGGGAEVSAETLENPATMSADIDNQGLSDLANFRAELGPIPGGGTADGGVVARLDVNGSSFYGVNAHGQEITMTVNPISATHAEADAFQQAFNAGEYGGAGQLFVDDELCGYCGEHGAVKSLARQLGLDSISITTPSGTITLPLR